jgi:succinyl-diaminopimelate desuccinylase
MDVIELTRRLVALDTAGHAENDAVALLAPILESAGFRLDVVEHEPGRGTLVAEWEVDRPEAPLCLSGHLDTVPFGAAPWERSPLGAELDGDRLHGRGTTDMKGGVAAIVVAACRVAAHRPARAGLRLVLTAAEETGSEGAAAAATRLAGRPSGPLVITEPTDNVVAFGHKGALWLSAQAHGVTAHGSMPHLGDNAVTKLAGAVTRIDGTEFAEDEHPAMGRPTLNVNSVPDHARRIRGDADAARRPPSGVDRPGRRLGDRGGRDGARGHRRPGGRTTRDVVLHRRVRPHRGTGLGADDHLRPGKARAGARHGRMVLRHPHPRVGRDPRTAVP